MSELPAILSHQHPDEAHEALRVGVVQAIEALSAQVGTLDDALLLLLTATDMAQGTLNTAKAARAQLNELNTRLDAAGINMKTALDNIDALQQSVTALIERVTALEQRP